MTLAIALGLSLAQPGVSSDQLDPASPDFATLRFAQDGLARLAALEAEAYGLIPETLRGERFSPVDVDCRWIAVHEGIDAARRSPDRAAYDAAAAAAERLVGAAVERVESFEGAARTPAGRLTRAAHADRILTGLWYDTPRTGEAAALVFEHMEARASGPRCRARQAAIAALDDLIASQGWPDDGDEQLAADITQTVQHAGRRTDLRQAALDWAEMSLETGGPQAARRYALIADRLRLIETGEQRYGTQGDCRDGVWIAAPILDPAEADAWRARHALPDLAAHARAMSGACG